MTDNRTLAAAYRKKHPEFTLQQIANNLGITKERVRQILKRDDLVTKHVHRYKNMCKICGKHLLSKTKSMVCMDCHRAVVICAYCGKEIHKGKALLSRHLKNQKNRKLKYKGNYYCDRKCFGAHIGKSVGFLAHPENAGRSTEKITSKQILAIRKLRSGGVTIKEIEHKFDICATTVYKCLKSSVSDDFS